MECPLPVAAIRPLFLRPAIRLTALLLGLLLLLAAAPTLAMELEGKTVYAWSASVKNEYAGSVLEVLKKEGEEVAASLKSEQERISENLGGLKITRNKVPDAIPLSAPYDGVISKMTLQPGQKLAAKAECFKVASKAISVKVRVYAEDFQQLHKGDEATATIQGIPDRTFPAVLFILPIKPVDKGFMDLSYYEIFFRVIDLDSVVREGLSARVTVP
jgi:hypothetical protein